MFRVMQFTGRGDPMFGGNADDRRLYLMPDSGYAFLAGYDVQRRTYYGEAIASATFASEALAYVFARSAIGYDPAGKLAVYT